MLQRESSQRRKLKSLKAKCSFARSAKHFAAGEKQLAVIELRKGKLETVPRLSWHW